MAAFKITRRTLTMEFTIKTAAKVTSFNGTPFVPNRCEARVESGTIVSVSLARVDENGWDCDDPAGPDGAVLSVSYGGGEIDPAGRPALPRIAQDAIDTVQHWL